MELDAIRKDIDRIDTQLVELFKERMNCAAEVAKYKIENGLRIYDPNRERALLNRVSELAGEEHEASVRVMFSLLMELSRSHQGKLILPKSKYEDIISSALLAVGNVKAFRQALRVGVAVHGDLFMQPLNTGVGVHCSSSLFLFCRSSGAV